MIFHYQKHSVLNYYSSLLLFHGSYIFSRLVGDSTVKGGERAKERDGERVNVNG
jgi:hypothetical protein